MHAQEICISNSFCKSGQNFETRVWEYLREISRGKLCFFQILSKERFCIKMKPLLFEITSIIQCVSANHWCKT